MASWFSEATRVAGSDRLILTGQLGDVMKESTHAGRRVRTPGCGSKPEPPRRWSH